jgi:tetratricopeptide (TPR) repeat protein
MKLAVLPAIFASFLAAQLAAPPAPTTDERIRNVERQLRASPRDAKLLTALVADYLQKLRETADGAWLDRASHLVDRLSEQDGGTFNTLRLRNEIDLQRHDFKAVAERARSMTRDEPSDAGNWGNLGDALMELGEYEAAGQAYTKMFAQRPNLASYNRLGFFRFVTGDAQAAIAFMRLAVEAGGELPENTAWCQAELGDLYFKTGQLPQARTAYQASLILFPSLHRAYAGLGRVEAAEGHTDAAVRNFEHAQAIVPLVEYAGALEDLYRKQGRNQKALAQQHLIDAIDKLGRARREQTNRALVLILANHDRGLERALELIEAEIPSRGDVYTWDAFSWVLFKLGRVQEARRASLRALRMSTPEPDFYRHAAQIAEAAGESTIAAQYREHLMK